MKAVLMHNPGLMIGLCLLLGGALVIALLSGLMARSGASLKGIVFFAVFFAIVVVPQVAGHLAMAVRPHTTATAADVLLASTGDAGFTIHVAGTEVRDPAQVFGIGHEHGQRTDARPLFASRMSGLRVAEAVNWPTGESVTALIFRNADEAAAGLLAYLGMYQVGPTMDRGGVEVQGVRGLGGGMVRIRRSGAAVLAVTALDEPALEARLSALPLFNANAAMASTTTMPTSGAALSGEPLVPALQPLARTFREHVLLQVLGVLMLVALAAWWFFYGSAWAGRVPAERGVAALPAATLKSRLLAVNQTDVPMTVDALPDGRIAVTWRYADARWVDFAGAHRAQRTQRLLLRLDEATRRVHATEQSTELDANVGLGGASLRWRTELGINFFQIDHRRILGVQLGPDGRPTGDLSYTWHFNSNELKAPLIASVTSAGWDWQPVVLDLPALLDRGTPAMSR